MATIQKPPEAQPASFPVTRLLLRDHTHAGKKLRKGEEIIITDAPTFAFLVQRGIVEKDA
jgi:hypothetical protein